MQHIQYILGRAMTGGNIQLLVTGLENIPRDRGFMLYANHQGMFDIFVLYGYVCKRFKWIMKDTLRKMPLLGRACDQTGHIFVNRTTPQKDLLRKYGGVTAEALVESALGHVRLLNDCNFDDICISVKCSRVPVNMAAYQMLHEKTDYPLHLGVTEAGTPKMGELKSAIGIGGLLCLGIGDTLRVSLTANPVEEIYAAKRILAAAGIRQTGPNLISCPTCGRTKIDLIKIAGEVEAALKNVKKPIKVAVMGCVVNGPGEARDADIGIAGGDRCAVLFKKGEIICKIKENEIVSKLLEEIEKQAATVRAEQDKAVIEVNAKAAELIMKDLLKLYLVTDRELSRGRTLEEVGKEFRITRERIRQIEAKALRKLRHPSRSKKLRDFLDS